ncbi:RodZ domain-containing protein [Streptomyces sp. TRM 70351]|uniref:helix-turn-helix domain-containing protein n=1 Tax=Streptomyces sp. TRM 70351 TaxID=3116552 RepID=UPI002E7BEA63|nr:RodZ domain-containing protein [Streptomyces sp. TRM 70351]MEE1926583.1 RodZ domain-containing protein [Streptomyces sp. TRM 70351]
MSIGNSPEEDRPSAGPHEDRPPVGRVLRQARIDAGLTVDEVSSATRVRVPIVQAIEQDDFSRCGGDVYARGHIRALARAVGLDPAGLIEQYDAEHGGRPRATPAAPLFEAERIRPEPRRPNWTAAMVAAIVAVVGFVGFTLFGGDDQSGTPVAKAEATPSASPSPTASDAGPAPEPSDSAIAAAPADKVTVKLVATNGNSWISAEDHTGRLMHEGVLEDGDSQTFTDDEQIDLVLGNAGAVEVFVNGKKVEPVGEVGQVQRVSYTKGDPAQG